MSKGILNLSVNIGLLISSLVAVFSGLLIQFYYHVGDQDFTSVVLGFKHFGWLQVHKISSILFSVFMLHHIVTLQKWYKVVIKKKLYSKHRQVIIFSVISVLVTITGFIPWFISTISDESTLGFILIEMHDKIGLIFVLYVLLHIFNRLNWFTTSFNNLRI
ncbi:DUF4405 domain-containing protein [Marinifilum sp. D737]|uniref:DUF4405 domain-containing protein n=1 Tax=Marinifilum sp. D737 TaxID=2969628 RepID=UPI0022766034|nr:DUF4405 domain-containing protein [Marinifilum sp. D737]MCY1633785.1 DUF4405 domain-containing protein [Marinifilum sp. D737]